MNLLQLNYFVTLVQAENISAAATRLFITPQALSEALIKLEKEVGAKLFVRERKIILTPAGKAFFSFAKQTILSKKHMDEEIEQMLLTQGEIINCGIATFVAPPFLAELLISFENAHPQATLNYISKNDYIRDFKNVNFIIADIEHTGYIAHFGAEWTHEIICQSNQFAVLVKDSLLQEIFGDDLPKILEKVRREKDLSIFKDLPFVSTRNLRNMQHRLLIDGFSHYNLVPKIGFQADMNSLNLDMCRYGIAAYFGPKGVCNYKKCDLEKLTDGIGMYDVDIPNMHTGLVVYYKKDSTLSKVQRDFMQHIKRFVSDKT